MLYWTLLGHLSVPLNCMKLNIRGNWRQKYNALLQGLTQCIPIHPQHLQVGTLHGGVGIDKLLPVECWVMDEPLKSINKIMNTHKKCALGQHFIKIDKKSWLKIHMCNFWAIKNFQLNSQLYEFTKAGFLKRFIFLWVNQYLIYKLNCKHYIPHGASKILPNWQNFACWVKIRYN